MGSSASTLLETQKGTLSLSQLSHLLEENPNLGTEVDQYGNPAVLLAVRSGKVDMVKLLAKSTPNIDFNRRSSTDSSSPLTIAVSQNKVEMVRYLLQERVDMSIPGEEGKLAFEIACNRNLFKIMKCMVDEFNALSIEVSKSGYFCNHEQQGEKQTEKGQEKEKDKEKEGEEKRGKRKGKAKGSDENDRIEEQAGQDAEDQTEFIDDYVDDGVSFGYDLPHHGPTEVQIGTKKGTKEQVNIKAEEENADTAYNLLEHVQGESGREEEDKEMGEEKGTAENNNASDDSDGKQKKRSSNPNESKYFLNHCGLHEAASNGHLKIIKYLLKRGVYIDVPHRKTNESPFIVASRWNQYEIMDYLLEQGANINAIDQKGWTALHYACEDIREEMIDYLLKRGASCAKKALGDNYKTPLLVLLSSPHMKKMNVYSELIEDFLDPPYGANLSAATKDNYNALHYAALKNSVKLARIFITRSKNKLLTQRTLDTGFCPLMLAIVNHSREVVEFIIQEVLPTEGCTDQIQEAIINGQDKDGNTCLHLAKRKGYVAIAQLLENYDTRPKPMENIPRETINNRNGGATSFSGSTPTAGKSKLLSWGKNSDSETTKTNVPSTHINTNKRNGVSVRIDVRNKKGQTPEEIEGEDI